MAELSPSMIMIYGGRQEGQDLSDGVLVDFERRKVIRSFNSAPFTFYCYFNRYCKTMYDAIVAIVTDSSNT